MSSLSGAKNVHGSFVGPGNERSTSGIGELLVAIDDEYLLVAAIKIRSPKAQTQTDQLINPRPVPQG